MNGHSARPGAARAALELALRSVLATAALLAVAHAYSREVVASLMPMLAAALHVLADDFRILNFGFADDRGNASIAAMALLDHTVVLGGRAIVPDGHSVVGVGVTLGTVLQPVLVAVGLALAWPGRSVESLLRLPLVAALVSVVMLLDTPFSMAAWLWFSQVQSYEPGRASPLLWWNVFLNGGGRLALGLVAGALAIVLAQRLATALGRSGGPSRAEARSSSTERLALPRVGEGT